LAPTVLRADITYTVDETGLASPSCPSCGTGSIIGTITTDGTIGTLATSDITDWNLTVSYDGSSFTLTGPNYPTGNSTVYVVGSDLTATATQLLFNFGGADGGYLFFQSPTEGVNAPYACFISDNSTNCFDANAIVGDPTSGTNGSSNPYEVVKGDIAIGTATPEPSSFSMAMLAIGLFGLIAMSRRRKQIALTIKTCLLL
jgi:hypothetical protein